MNLPTRPLAGRTRMLAGPATRRTGNGLRVAFQSCLLATPALSGCAAPPPVPSQPWCASPELLAVCAGGALHGCDVHSGGRVRIEIRPEDEPPINPSPWYAFRLSPRGITSATVELVSTAGYARYWPKLSVDGESFEPLPADLESDFATAWLGRARARAPGYEFRQEPREVSDQPNTKNYFFRRYRIPAITYEVGDEADCAILRRSTPVFAEEMMRLMLER